MLHESKAVIDPSYSLVLAEVLQDDIMHKTWENDSAKKAKNGHWDQPEQSLRM